MQHVRNGERTSEGHAVTVTVVAEDHVVCTGFNTSPASGDAATWSTRGKGTASTPGRSTRSISTTRTAACWSGGFLNPI